MKKAVMGITCLLMSIVYAQVDGEPTNNIDVPFDVNAVIEQVSTNVATLQGEDVTESLLDPGFIIDTNFVYAPVGVGTSRNPIAFNGTYYLVAWADWRTYFGDVYAARVDTSGTVLDSAGIAVCTTPGDQNYPAVESDGSNYLVVWSDRRIGNYDIYGARITTDGTVLDPDGFTICTATGDQVYPQVTFDGTNYLVVWQDNRAAGNDIYGARISTSGIVLSEFAICNAALDQTYPVVSFGGTNYLVAWRDYRNGSNDDIYAQRLNTSGGVIGENIVVCGDLGSNANYPSLAFDGTNHLVVWQDDRNTDNDIYGARVDASGAVLDTNGFAISIVPGRYQYNPQAAFDGTNYMVVWHHSVAGSGLSYDVYGVRVDTSGTVLDTTAVDFTPIPKGQQEAQLAFDGTNYLVVWKDYRTTSANVFATRVTTSCTVLDTNGFLISMAANGQYYPAVSFDGTNYLVVWQDVRNDLTSKLDIYGARVEPSGTILDPYGIAISTAVGVQVKPYVTFGGTNYFVVWRDERNYPTISTDVYGQLVSTAGALVGNEVPVCTTTSDQYDINVGYGGGKYLVVWYDWLDFWNPQIQGQLVNTAGQLAGPPINITNSVSWRFHPCVAFDGTNYMVVWEDYRSGAMQDIYGARVDTSGMVLDTSGIEIVVSFLYKWGPSIVFDGTNYTVFYCESNPDADIYARRVDTSGVVLDTVGIVISDAIGDQGAPRVALGDSNYVVVWQDMRNYPTAGIDIYGVIVNRSLTVIDSFAMSLWRNQADVAVASGLGDQGLIVYAGYVDSLGGRPAETMRIWGTFAPIYGVEEMTDVVPTASMRLNCYPNPFTQMTEIKYEIAESRVQNFSLSIYDISGRLVRQFAHLPNHSVNTVLWGGKDNAGRNLPSGVYFAQLKSNASTCTEKIIKLK